MKQSFPAARPPRHYRLHTIDPLTGPGRGGRWQALRVMLALLLLLLLLPLVQLRAQTFTQIANGSNHSLVMRADGTLLAWGYNGYSQLGSGNTTSRTIPAPVVAPVAAVPGTRWLGVAGGTNHNLALRTDNTLWAWGYNSQGQLGDGSTTTRVSPVLVPTPPAAAPGTSWSQFVTAENHSAAIRSDGTLWTWGYNNYGQLGDGTYTNRLSPLQIAAPTGAPAGSTWTRVAVGRYHSLALRSDGSLWAWGYNGYGAVGDNTTSSRIVPTAVQTPAGAAAGTRWSLMAAGDYYSMGLRSDGTLWGWGYNGYGQLGDASATASRVPVAVITPGTVVPGSRWAQVACGHDHTAAIRTDGSLWAWGYNNYGQLGDNTTTNRSTPVRETSNGSWIGLTASQNNTLALLIGSRQIFGTGYNAYGQLGDGTTTNSLVFRASLASALAARPAAGPPLGLYPNPAHGRCQLPALPAAATLRLADALGRTVRTQPAAPTLNLEGLPAGLYLLTMEAPGEPARSARLAVE